MEKKQIAIYVLIALLIILLIGTIFFLTMGGFKSREVGNATSTSPFTEQENKVITELMNNTTTEKWINLRTSLTNSIEYQALIKIADMSQKSAGNVAQIPFEFQGKKWQLNCGLIDLSQPAPQPQATTTEK